jgi:hypothetical protein
MGKDKAADKAPDTEDRIQELGGRTWAELEIIPGEDGHMLVRDQIRERDPASGAWRAIPVRVRIPRAMDLIRARADARAWFATFKDLDADRDAETFEEMEQLCLLALAIRTAQPPHAQLVECDELATRYEEASLRDLLGRLRTYRDMLDPRVSVKDENDFWHLIASVARVGHLGPLTDIAGHEQPSCVIFMARQALQSPTGQSWLQSQESSIAELSRSKNSSGS